MTAAEHNRFAENAGAYVLGALDETEVSAFERHLATCHVCQDDVDHLRAAAHALPRSVEQFNPPPTLRAALMEQVHAEAPAPVGSGRTARAPTEPRRTLAERLGLGGGFGPRLAAVAAALLLAVGLAGGLGLSAIGGEGDREGGERDKTRTIAAAVDTTRVGKGRAALVVHRDGNAELRVSAMPQPRRGQIYEVWYQRGDEVEPGPLFSVDSNGRGVAAVPGDLDGVTAILVTRERTGGAQQPTEAPVVRAKV